MLASCKPLNFKSRTNLWDVKVDVDRSLNVKLDNEIILHNKKRNTQSSKKF